MGRGKPFEALINTVADALCNIAYFSCVIAIELYMRPLFPRRGVRVPLLTNLILTVMELAMLASVGSHLLLIVLSGASKVVRSLDRLSKQIKKSKMISHYRQQRWTRPAQQEEHCERTEE